MRHLRCDRATLAGLALGMSLALSGAAAYAATLHVAPTGADTNNGLTWDHPKKTIAAALAAAASGDQVWVAAGTYNEHLTLKNGVALYGGFTGLETRLAQRDIRANLAILDGQKAGCVISAGVGITLATRLDGFTLRNGSGKTLSGDDDAYGGAIYCDRASPTIANNIILSNIPTGTVGYGGGIYCTASSPLIHDNVIEANTADVGGGICCADASAPLIVNNTIVSNAGAAIVCLSASPAVIANNILAFNAGGISVASNATPTLKHNCVFNPDSANYTGLDPGATDIAVDPQLSAVAFAETHLLPSSPCIDAGDDASVQFDWLDIDGQPRVRFAHVDIGADEYDGLAPFFVPTVIHVSPTGDDTHDGLTWATAKKTVQAGINAVAASGGEVWVSAGTYTERLGFGPWIHVYGGFAGTEFDRDRRDWAAHVTILDGNAGGSVVTIATGTGHRTTRIDGFTIRNGTGTAVSSIRYGGAIYAYRGAPVIANNTITANTASSGYGGAIYCHLYPAAITNNIIAANSSASGGAIYCSSCSPSITHNTITNNTATNGGAIFCNAASPAITYNQLARNNASSGNGGAIYCTASSPTITNNALIGNTAASSFGGAIYCQTSSTATITNNSIAANIANGGGGIYCLNSSPLIANNTLVGNSAGTAGAIYVNSSAPPITNNTLTGNTASTSAGGIYLYNASPAITNNLIAFNSAGIVLSGGTPTLTNNCVHNPYATNYTGLTAGASDISVDPLLSVPEYGDVHLAAGSPCINAGSDAAVQSTWTDLDGQPRTQADHVDIGADEFSGTVPPYSAPVTYVTPTGLDASDGASWSTAKATLQAAVDAALLAGGDVWVAAGTYNQRFTLKPRVHVFGGFAGTESARNQRDSTAHATILDGSAGGSVVTVSAGWRLSTLDGFTIRNGTGTLSGGNRLGGGVYCLSAAPFITNNFLTANTASPGLGGGIYASACAPVLAHNTLSGNTATSGGGVYLANAASAFVYNSRIAGNTATNGAAIYCAASAPILFNNNIAGNGANSCGGIYCFSSSPTITNNTIVANSATDYGAIYCASSSSPALTNNIVAFNSSGIYKSSGTPTLSHNCLYNPGAADYTGLTAGTGDIAADPRLVAVDYGEVHLDAASPCIDAGLDTAVTAESTDLDGQARILGAHADIGADEFDGVTPVFAPRVVRVSPSGDNAHDGATWPTAKKTVQAGIDAAFATGGEVWVAAGTYGERITLRPWAYVYGGFAGTETQLNQRDSAAHVTILDGGAAGSVVTAQSGGRNSGLDGFTLRNGSGTTSGSNRLGGGVYCVFSSPRIAHNLITANTATSGGGLYISSCAPVVTANTITANSATAGGGLYCASATAYISDNTISANAVTTGHGGGIYCSSLAPTIANNRILRNTAANSYGGGIYCAAPATISADLIAGNVAVNGAGIYCASSAPQLVNSLLVGNRAIAFGGAMYNLTSTPTLTNCTLAANAAGGTTGLYNNSSTTLTLANCILWGHAGTLITNLSSSTAAFNHCDVQTTVAGSGNFNLDPKFTRAPTPGTDAAWGTADDDYGDLHLLIASPCIDAGANVAFLATASGTVSADSLTDYDGRRRFYDDPATSDCIYAPDTCGTAPIVDVGAYEFAPAPGDFDHDNDVDFDDRDAIAACQTGPAITPTPACLAADFDGDNDVDQTDFGLWQRCFSGPNHPANPACAH